MKSLCILMALVLILVAGNVCSRERTAASLNEGTWDMTWTAGFNAMAKLVEAEPGSDALADVVPVIAGNGGLSFYYKDKFVINAPVIIIGPRDDSLDKWNMMVALTVGVLRNKIWLGPFYDFGARKWDHSRLGALFSFGLEF